MSMLKWPLVAAAVGIAVCIGCSREDRDEVVERGGNAWNALKGEDSSGEKTPRIVKEQQRKERRRQNATWTPENRANHPVEYCQAQLEELAKFARELDARAHEKSCAIAAVKREIGDGETRAKSLAQFLDEAKKTYRECEASGNWPARLGGYSLSREKTQEKIVDAAQKLAEIQSKSASKSNQLVALEKTLKTTQDEQRRVVKLREQIQNTIGDLRIKKAIDGDDGIASSLNAIADAMGVIGADYDDPSVESLVQPDGTAAREDLFKKIMAE